MAETDAHLAANIERDEAVLDDRATNDADRQRRFDAWEAEEKAKADYANSEQAFDDKVAAAVQAALKERGVQDDPSRALTAEELAPARQLSPTEQGHYNRTKEIPEVGLYHDVHLTSHAPL
jgi:hypothetical protein